MLSEWEKFAGWKVLRHFLANPSTEFYIRELARSLKLSPGSAQIYCNAYAKDGILISENKANAKMFRLDNSKPVVKAIKKFYFLERLESLSFTEQVVKTNLGLITLAIYGSYASGEYDEKSDIDLLVISDNKTNRESFIKLQKTLGKSIQLTEFTTAEWLSKRNKNEPFIISVIHDHIILFGGRL